MATVVMTIDGDNAAFTLQATGANTVSSLSVDCCDSNNMMFATCQTVAENTDTTSGSQIATPNTAVPVVPYSRVYKQCAGNGLTWLRGYVWYKSQPMPTIYWNSSATTWPQPLDSRYILPTLLIGALCVVCVRWLAKLYKFTFGQEKKTVVY